MPARKFPLVTGEFYHVFNRGINKQSIFLNDWDYQRAIMTAKYYKIENQPIKLSYLLAKPKPEIEDTLKRQQSLPSRVSTLAYCLMPNHFHFLLRQSIDGGISNYLADLQNSYTKYFNAKHKRSGSLLDRQFKAVHIETQEQLTHVIRYIQLNPYSSQLIKEPTDIFKYPYSYVDNELLKNFSDINIKEYRDFVLDHADFQRQLEYIKHLSIDSEA